jgi:hypothetical protein
MQPLLLYFVFLGVPASPFRLRRRLGPHPLAQPLGAERGRRREGAAPFCRARAEVLSYAACSVSFFWGGPPIT